MRYSNSQLHSIKVCSKTDCPHSLEFYNKDKKLLKPRNNKNTIKTYSEASELKPVSPPTIKTV